MIESPPFYLERLRLRGIVWKNIWRLAFESGRRYYLLSLTVSLALRRVIGSNLWTIVPEFVIYLVYHGIDWLLLVSRWFLAYLALDSQLLCGFNHTLVCSSVNLDSWSFLRLTLLFLLNGFTRRAGEFISTQIWYIWLDGSNVNKRKKDIYKV